MKHQKKIMSKEKRSALKMFIISGEAVLSTRDDPDSAQPVYLSNIIKHITHRQILSFNTSKDYPDLEHPNINWGMCRKLLPYKTEEQKKINAIRCEAEAKALMLKLATETHKQKQAREKLKETQRVMGKKNIVEFITNLGPMPLNCLIFQDDIARMNTTLDQARTGAKIIGETLERKQLKSNSGKSKYVLLGSKALKNKTRKEASANPIMMGEEIMEGSDEEKYLGDQIHTDGSNAIILSTINKRIAKSIRKLNEILGLTENPLMSGMKNTLCARNLYVCEVASSIINNCEFWIGVKDEAIDIL